MLQKIIDLGIYLIVFSLPFYLVGFKIGWVPVNLLEIMIYGLFIIWLIQVLVLRIKPRIDQENKNWFYAIFLIFLGLTQATLLSVDLKISAGIWKGWFIVPFLFFVVLASHLKTKKQIKNIFIALTLSGLGVSLIALFYWFNNNLTYDGRLRAFYLSPNHLAMYLSPILILSLFLYSSLKKNSHKIILFLVQGLLFIVIYLTYSYGAWLGLLAGFVFLVISQSNKKIALTFFLIAVFCFVTQIPSQKFQSLLDSSYPSLESRLVIWQSAGEIIKDHPLIGIGPGMFQKYYLDYQLRFEPYPEWAVPQPHNLFLAFWLQAGLFGLIGFIWLLVVFFKSAVSKKVRDDAFGFLPFILMAVMIYTLAHGLIDTTYWKNDLSVIFWLIIVLNYKASRLFC
jgi:O-antigen ligase